MGASAGDGSSPKGGGPDGGAASDQAGAATGSRGGAWDRDGDAASADEYDDANGPGGVERRLRRRLQQRLAAAGGAAGRRRLREQRVGMAAAALGAADGGPPGGGWGQLRLLAEEQQEEGQRIDEGHQQQTEGRQQQHKKGERQDEAVRGERPLPGRRRPLIYVYNVPAAYVSRMLSYRLLKDSCTWRVFDSDPGNKTRTSPYPYGGPGRSLTDRAHGQGAGGLTVRDPDPPV
jgi:hypothetical protein